MDWGRLWCHCRLTKGFYRLALHTTAYARNLILLFHRAPWLVGFLGALLSQALSGTANLLLEPLPCFAVATVLLRLGKQVLDVKFLSRLGPAKEPISANKSFISNLMMKLTPRVLSGAASLSRLHSRLLGARWLSLASSGGWKRLLPYQTAFALSRFEAPSTPSCDVWCPLAALVSTDSLSFRWSINFP